MMNKSGYGLQLRVAPSQQKKRPTRPPLPTALGFGDDDDDVEKEIFRHASKNKALKDIEEQKKKALEEDPLVFDYDEVYEDMKAKADQPRAQDRKEKKSKYIQLLMEKAKQREREQEIIYERNIAKERSKDDHLFADKDKFVTAAYKRKLQEQAKWLEEERLRELREERDDVTKKTDISDFYFNLKKNVAFGGVEGKSKKAVETEEKPSSSGNANPQNSMEIKQEEHEKHEASVSPPRKERDEVADKPHSTAVVESSANDQPKVDHHKRSQDAVAAAKERFLARKRAKQQ